MAPERARCGAKTHQGTICKKYPVPGRTRCRWHGGLTVPAGPGHHNWKTGKYSILLQGRGGGLRELYENALQDPDLASMRRELALLDALLFEALEQYSARAGGGWAVLTAALERFEEARVRGDRKQLAERLDALVSLIKEGGKTEAIQDRIRDLIEQRRKVAEGEQKREALARNSVTAAQAMAILMRVAESVRDNVQDPEARRRIQSDVAALMGGTPPLVAEPIAVEAAGG